MNEPLSMARMRLAARLRRCRELVGLTQAAVAETLGMHRPTISEVEAGRRAVESVELYRFAKLYEVGVADLLEDSDGPAHDAVSLVFDEASASAPPEDGRPAPEPCTTCDGQPHPSGKPCVCGGANTIHAEVQGLREAALEAHVLLGWYPNIRPKDGRPTYAELVEAMRDAAGVINPSNSVWHNLHRLLSRIPKEEG